MQRSSQILTAQQTQPHHSCSLSSQLKTRNAGKEQRARRTMGCANTCSYTCQVGTLRPHYCQRFSDCLWGTATSGRGSCSPQPNQPDQSWWVRTQAEPQDSNLDSL